jgi:hypothetical protein
MTRLFLPALGLLALAACSSTPTDDPTPRDPGGGATQEGPKDDAKDTTELEQKLDYAQRELAIAEVGAAARVASAERALVVAEQNVASANEELETYKGMEIEREKESAKLQVDRANHSRILARQSNDALRIQFAQEEEAMSEDPVLQKSQRELDMAERGYAQAQRAQALKVQIEIPRKQAKLEQAKASAEAALEAARRELDKTRMSVELELLRKQHAVDAARKKLGEATDGASDGEGDGNGAE